MRIVSSRPAAAPMRPLQRTDKADSINGIDRPAISWQKKKKFFHEFPLVSTGGTIGTKTLETPVDCSNCIGRVAGSWPAIWFIDSGPRGESIQGIDRDGPAATSRVEISPARPLQEFHWIFHWNKDLQGLHQRGAEQPEQPRWASGAATLIARAASTRQGAL